MAPMKTDPIGLPRNPFHVFLFVICVMNGLTFLVGASTSSTLTEALTPMVLQAYGGLLTVGGLAVLVGMFWQGSRNTGLLVKRVGYVALAGATLIYAIVLAWVVRTPDAFLASSITLCFSLICMWQVHEINRVVKVLIRVEQEGLVP